MSSLKKPSQKIKASNDPNDGALISVDEGPPIHEEDAEFLAFLGFRISRRERKIGKATPPAAMPRAARGRVAHKSR